MQETDKSMVMDFIETFRLNEAENMLHHIGNMNSYDDEVCYLLGNISRKRNNWKEALQWYAKATEQNAESPARHAREMIIQIMDFYDKERYNV